MSVFLCMTMCYTLLWFPMPINQTYLYDDEDSFFGQRLER